LRRKAKAYPMSEGKVFTEFGINRFTLRNRLGVAPMTRMSSPSDSIPRKDVLELLVRRAQHGAAIVYTEAIVTDYESAQGYPRQARLLTQRQIEAWRPVVRAIQEAGAVAMMQMFHCGRIAWPEVNPAGRTIAPSALASTRPNRFTGQPYPVPDAMGQFDIEHVIQGFVETAKGALAAGFDGVEIHGAHGYLISEFLSAYSNHRTDGYGGPVNRRYRFAHEVVQAVRAVVPHDRLLTFRISNWSAADPDISLFETAKEWQAIIRWLAQDGLDAISVSTQGYAQPAFGTGQRLAQLTREATPLPILICGGIHNQATAEDALADADVALSAKSILLNPDWIEDVRQGKPLKPRTPEESLVAYTDTPLP